MQKILTLNTYFEKANTQVSELGAENAELKHQNDSLFLQLVQLYETERRVREEHLQKLNDSIDLARKAIIQFEDRLHQYVKNQETEKAESLMTKLESLHEVLVMSVCERDARQKAHNAVLENYPEKSDPTRFLFELKSKDDLASVDRLGSMAAFGIILRSLNEQMSNEQLSTDKTEALDQLAQIRKENAELKELWRSLVTGIARAMQLDLSVLAEMHPEQQAEQLALGIGELKMQKLTSGDLAERVTLLQDQLDDIKNHNAALRKAMESDPSREAVAAYEYTALAAEVQKASIEKRWQEANDELDDTKRSMKRLQEAVRVKDATGLLALEAPELAILSTERIMHLVQVCITAAYQKPGGMAEAEIVVSSDQELGALNSFLHLPLVSANSFRLPPQLLTNLGPLQVKHVAHNVCATTVVVARPSNTKTLRPSQPEKISDLRKLTLQGLGAMQDLIDLKPPRVPDFSEPSDTDENKKPSH
jgi:hypothetical protein